MEPSWAAENLQVIRTLMERSAIYRRALAPVMLFLGLLGVTAALTGAQLPLESSFAFVSYWLGVALAGAGGAFLLVRRQALKEGEPFWSPPTRRVTQAFVPALVAGAALGVMVMTAEKGLEPQAAALLPPLWMALYGCAIHAAGFFMRRGFKLFGWLFVGAASVLFLVIPASDELVSTTARHAMMGVFFGGLHLVYGIYLYFTESKAE
jgi:hypothetical protein